MNERDLMLEALRPLVRELFEEELDRLRSELQPEAKQELYTVEEAAAFLRCSPRAVRMRAKRGRLAERRQGRRVYITGESLRGVAAEGRD